MAEDEAEDADWFERALENEASDDRGDESDTEDPLVEVDEQPRTEESEAPSRTEESEVPSRTEEPEGPTRSEEQRSRTEDSSDPFESEDEVLDIDLEGDESFGFDVGEKSDGFEEEDYQAEIPRINVGIEGLDAMIQEGVPERSLLSVIGGAGTGKTTFALQFLQEALETDGRAVFITLEESRDRIFNSARQKGWDFEGAADAGNLAILDLDPVDMANSLTSIRSELPRLVGSFGADRLALDSVSLLEMMYDEQATRRTEIYDFARALKTAGVTTLVTSEASERTSYASRFGIIEYLTDAVFVLQYVRPDDFQETRLAVEIQKIRDANHSRETKPYEITNEGISVYRDATIF